MRKSILLLCCACNILLANTIYARDAIVFREWSPARLLAINPDGSNLKTIQEDVYTFTVSPDRKKLVVFNLDCRKSDICTITIYDLTKATKKTTVQPHAEWFFGKWISSGDYFVSRRVRQDNGGQACGTGNEVTGCAADAIIQTAKFNIESLSFTVEKDYGVGNYKALERDFPTKPVEIDNTSNSPDNRYSLVWKGPDYWNSSLVLRTNDSNDETKIFQRKPSDFSENYSFTDLPWSPNSQSFVIDYYPGGLFYNYVLRCAQDCCVGARKSSQAYHQ